MNLTTKAINSELSKDAKSNIDSKTTLEEILSIDNRYIPIIYNNSNFFLAREGLGLFMLWDIKKKTILNDILKIVRNYYTNHITETIFIVDIVKKTAITDQEILNRCIEEILIPNNICLKLIEYYKNNYNKIVDKFKSDVSELNIDTSIDYLVPALCSIYTYKLDYLKNQEVNNVYYTYGMYSIIKIEHRELNSIYFDKPSGLIGSGTIIIGFEELTNSVKLIVSTWCQRIGQWSTKYGTDQQLAIWNLIDWIIGPISERYRLNIPGNNTMYLGNKNNRISKQSALEKIRARSQTRLNTLEKKVRDLDIFVKVDSVIIEQEYEDEEGDIEEDDQLI